MSTQKKGYKQTNVSNNTVFSKSKPIIDFEAKYSKFLSKYDHLKVLFPFWEQNNLPDNLVQSSNMIALGSGTPNECLFPIENVQISLKKSPTDKVSTIKTHISMINENTAGITSEHVYSLSSDSVGSSESVFSEVSTGSSKTTTSSLEDTENLDADLKHLHTHPRRLSIRESLQYGDTCFGNYKTLDMIKSLLIKFKTVPPYANWDYLVTSGTSASTFKICQLLVDEHTTVLVEEFTYPVFLSNVKFANGTWVPLKLQFDTGNIENQGLDIAYFKHLLENWDSLHPDKNKPSCFYTIPTGQNPTGMTVSREKRQQIYDLCCKHDIIIIEDDPYGYLKFPKYNPQNPLGNPYRNTEHPMAIDHYINNVLIPSYMTIDSEGRVLRCETFSKICAPGLRLGFVAGNQFLIKRLMNVIDVSTREPSGLSQGAILNTMIALDEKYSASQHSYAVQNRKMAPLDGWVTWCMNIAGEYLHRRNLVLSHLYGSESYLRGEFSVLEPSAGMFASIVINLKEEWKQGLEIKKAMDYLNYCLLEEGCDCILGYKMTVDEQLSMGRSNFLRITFAQAANDEILVEAAHRIAKSIARLFAEYQTPAQKFEVPNY